MVQKVLPGGPVPERVLVDTLGSCFDNLQNSDRGKATTALAEVINHGVEAVPRILGRIESCNSEKTPAAYMEAADLILATAVILAPKEGEASPPPSLGDLRRTTIEALGKYTVKGENEVGVRKFAEWAVGRIVGKRPTFDQASADIASASFEGFFKPVLGAADFLFIDDPRAVDVLMATSTMETKNKDTGPVLRGTAAFVFGRKFLGEPGVDTWLMSRKTTDKFYTGEDGGQRPTGVDQIAREALKGSFKPKI
ncbi:MAG: hypothetical protein V1703_02030 [Candidatus Altiarchaeota archaeon]